MTISHLDNAKACRYINIESICTPTSFSNILFYKIKPLIPRALQIFLRQRIALIKRRRFAHTWPIDLSAGDPPKGWIGWPGGKRFALVLSHDVDSLVGCNNVLKLADIEERIGFRSAFNFVPERYGCVSIDLINELKKRGFGVGVHGLHHDGKLFRSKKIFDKRALRINSYLKEWGTRGFTAPSMICKLEWMHGLNILYSTSTFDTDPFEPQPHGVGTIFPLVVEKTAGKPESLKAGTHSGLPAFQPAGIADALPPSFQPQASSFFIELPYTLPQDCTLFIILREKDISAWKEKLDWIVVKGGMALLNSHPDYICFERGGCDREKYPVELYIDFLNYVRSRYENQHWCALPEKVAEFWSQNYVQGYE